MQHMICTSKIIFTHMKLEVYKCFEKLLKSEVIFKTLFFTVLFIVVGSVPILSKMNVMELASIS